MLEPTLIRFVACVTLCIALPPSPAGAQESRTASALLSIDVERFLPVRTDAMTVGPFETRYRRTGVSQPFFIIGCDSYSLAWIERNAARLKGLGALGLVVDAPDAQAYRRLEAVAAGLVLRPVGGNALTEHLGIDKYPALVTAEGIFP